MDELGQFRRRARRAKKWSDEARRSAAAGHERGAKAAERLARRADEEGSPQSAAAYRETAARHRAAARRLALAGPELSAEVAEWLADLAEAQDKPEAGSSYREMAAHLRAEARRVAGGRVLDSGQEAFVAMDAGGFITDWSPQAESTFGWTREDALGKALADAIIPGRYRRAHREGLQRFLETGEGPMVGRRVEISALHRDGYEFPVELTVCSLETDGGPSFYSVLRDISERRLIERYLRAQNAISQVLVTHESLNEAIPPLLAAIGAAMEWRVGGYWTEEEPGILRCRETWRSEAAFEPFEHASRKLELAPGVGLPGLVWKSGEPAWLEDASCEPKPYFRRAAAAAEVGLHSAISLPVRRGMKLVGAMEFFSDSVQHAEPTLIEMMTTLSAQIGRFVTLLEERGALRRRLRDAEAQRRAHGTRQPPGAERAARA